MFSTSDAATASSVGGGGVADDGAQRIFEENKHHLPPEVAAKGLTILVRPMQEKRGTKSKL